MMPPTSAGSGKRLEVKTTMIQEVHHRVKNNLQTIAAMLRMQAGARAEDSGTEQALKEAVNRILSMSVIHEFLSRTSSHTINIRDAVSGLWLRPRWRCRSRRSTSR